MYYNMGVIGASDENSIYDEKIAHRYIASLHNYSLPLSIALPVFSWGVHIRNHQVTNLIGGLRHHDLSGEGFEKTGENRYRVEAISEAEALEKFQRNEAELVEEKILTESGPSTIIALEDPELKKAA